MIEDLNSIFEDPTEEENLDLPNAEIAQDDIAVEEEEPIIDHQEEEVEEVDLNQLFNDTYNTEVNSEEFTNYANTFGNIQITSDLSGGKSTLAELKANRLYDRSNGLFRVDEFTSPEAQASAIAFNNKVEEERQKYQDAMAPLTRVALPGVATTFEDDSSDYIYKYEITPDGKLQYFYKRNENEDWILQENKAGKWAIQTYFGQNDSTISDVKNYYREYNQYMA